MYRMLCNLFHRHVVLLCFLFFFFTETHFQKYLEEYSRNEKISLLIAAGETKNVLEIQTSDFLGFLKELKNHVHVQEEYWGKIKFPLQNLVQ